MARFRRQLQKELGYELAKLREAAEGVLGWVEDVEVTVGLRPKPPEWDDDESDQEPARK